LKLFSSGILISVNEAERENLLMNSIDISSSNLISRFFLGLERS